MRRLQRWRIPLAGAALVAAVASALSFVSSSAGASPAVEASASTPVPGSQGTDTALPHTASAVTISGAAVLGSKSPFAKLKITVNQTKELSNQAVSVTWTGGAPTDTGAGIPQAPTFNDNFLQIFECWGPDDGSNPKNPGPSPVGCEFGANYEASVSAETGSSNVLERALPPGDKSPGRYVVPGSGGNSVYMPFQPVDGTAPIDLPTVNIKGQGGQLEPQWANPYFDDSTTNEIDASKTYPNGTGSELFTVDTGLEAPGLGCGEQVTQPNGTVVSPQCWLVVVPRGSPSVENPKGGPTQDVGTSPLSQIAWAHRIAFPLSFNPIGSSCPIGAHEERIVGSELAAPAITNWSPTLCASPNSPPYQFSSISDDQARQQVTSGGTGGPGMAVISNPIPSSDLEPGDPATYAPLTLSGVVIGFNVDRLLSSSTTNQAEAAIAGERVAHLYLTPRLVAKLLTESYVDQFYELNPTKPPTGYGWLANNPQYLFDDPDFLQFNPEFRLLDCEGIIDCSGLVVEQPTSDAATVLWQWVLADPEARAWLAGTPDPWGMKVNPYYSTNAQTNPSGVALNSTPLESYPKSDPYTYQNPTELPGANNQLPRPLGMEDFQPYALTMQVAAEETRAANDGAKLNLNDGALSPDVAWTASGAQPPTKQVILSITDSADAAQYGLQMASLSRAGDDTSTRSFVAPTTAALEAGEAAMVPSGTAGVLAPDVSTTAAGAYPLTMLTYAAVTAPSLAKVDCQDYASFIDYAAGAGQMAGSAVGDLPPGYAPLPATLTAQSVSAAHSIVADCGSLSLGSTTATTASTTSTTVVQSTSLGNSTTPSGGSTTPTATPATVATTVAPTKLASTPAPATVPTTVKERSPSVTVLTSTGKTASASVGAVRLVLPIVLGVGVLAALLARWWDVWRRQIRPARPAR